MTTLRIFNTKKLLLIISAYLLLNTLIFSQSKQINLDTSAINLFWEIHDILVANREPTTEQWDKLFNKNGYMTLEKYEQRRKDLIDIIKIAYLSSRKTERDNLIKNPDSYHGYVLNHLLEVPKYRQEVGKILQKNVIEKIYAQAMKEAQKFLPEGTTKNNPSPSIAFIYFGNARGYDPMLFDPLYLLQYPDKSNLMGHEIHHYFRRFLARKTHPLGNDMLVWVIINVESEGIAGRVEKDSVPGMSLDKLKKHFIDKQTFEYFKEYQTIYANSNNWLKFSEKIMEQIFDDPAQRDELGKKLHRELPDNGRAMGTFMSKIIEDHFGRKRLNSTVGNAYDFWLLYNQAAKLSKGKAYVLSDKAIKVIENTRDKYLIK